MATKDQLWRDFVASFEIDVPEERIEEEYWLVRSDMKHRMMYDQMSGEGSHLFPEAELAEQENALREAALFEAKEPLVLRALSKVLDIKVTPEELVAEAEAIAKRQNSTVEEIKRFFGEDLALLERDVRERKIRDWACDQDDRILDQEL